MKLRLALFTMLIILLVGTVSASDWTGLDNYKDVSEDNRTISVWDSGQLGEDIKLGEAKLNTPFKNTVGVGYVQVAEFEIESFDNQNIFSEIEFYNAKTMNPIEIQFDYKYKDIKLIDIPTYEKVCEGEYENKTKNCTLIKNGTKKIEIEEWKDYNESSPSGKLTLGIFTTTYEGQSVEWIPLWYGKKLDEWAGWSAGLEVNLLIYYELEDNTTNTTVTDSHTNKLDGISSINTSSLSIEAKVNNGFDLESGSSHYIYLNGFDFADYTTTTVSLWFKPESIGVEQGFFTISTGTSGKLRFELGMDTSGYVRVRGRDTADGTLFSETSSTQLSTGNWYHLVGIWDSTNNKIQIFINGGSDEGGSNVIGAFSSDATLVSNIGAWENVSWFVDGVIDEVGVWNRTLTEAEISQLYNGGDGIGYQVGNAPNVLLNSPIDYYNSTNETVIFNATAYDDDNLVNVSLYLDGVLNETNSSGINNSNYIFTKDLSNGTHVWSILAYNNLSLSNQSVNRTLTIDFSPPNILLNSPIDYYNSSSESITFNVTVTEDNEIVKNVSLYLDGVLNETNSSEVNGTYIFTKTISEGNHNWSITSTNNNSKSATSSTRTFTIDLTAPSVSIILPNSNSTDNYVTTSNTTATLNWTSSDSGTGLDTCWVYNISSGSNSTVTCGDNQTFSIPYGTHTFYVYANDTVGNENSSSVTYTWKYKVRENSTSFNSSTYETAKEGFTANYTLGSDYSTMSANLIYNGTSYLATKTGSGNFEKILDVPRINGHNNASHNHSVKWSVTVSNATTSETLNSSITNQTATDLAWYLCNGTWVGKLVNYSIWNESDYTSASVTMKATFNYWLGGGSVRENNTFSLATNNSFAFCGENMTDKRYFTEPIILLEGTGYRDRTYIFYTNYTNTTTNTSLFMLRTEGTEVIIQVRDSGLQPSVDTYVIIERFYPANNSYEKIVEEKTDIYGQFVANLVENTVKYRFTFKDGDNTILKETDDMTVACRATICVLPFILEDTTDDFDTFENESDYDWTFTFSNATNIFTFTWTDSSTSSATNWLKIERRLLNGTTLVYNSTSTSKSATLSYNVGSQDASYTAQAFRKVGSGTWKRIGLLSKKVGTTARTFGKEGLFWSFIMLMTLIVIGYWNPPIGIILYLAGILILGLTKIMYINPAILFAEAAIGIAFVIAFSRRRG